MKKADSLGVRLRVEGKTACLTARGATRELGLHTRKVQETASRSREGERWGVSMTGGLSCHGGKWGDEESTEGLLRGARGQSLSDELREKGKFSQTRLGGGRRPL